MLALWTLHRPECGGLKELGGIWQTMKMGSVMHSSKPQLLPIHWSQDTVGSLSETQKGTVRYSHSEF